MRRTKKLLLVAFLLLWLMVVVTAYYWGHQYQLLPVVAGLIRLAGQLVVLALIGLVAYGAGRLIARLVGLDFKSYLEEAVYTIGLGLALMSLLVLAFGLLGVISRPLFWILTALLLLVTVISLLRERGENRYPVAEEKEPLQRFDYLVLAFMAMILLLGLLLALSPPIGWDGLTTHLVLVRDILQDGELNPSPYIQRPIVGHLIFVWGMALGGDVLPQLLSYSQGLLMVAAVAMFARQHFGRRTAILAAAFLCSVEVFLVTAAWPYTDIPTALFGLLSVFSLVNWQLGQRNSRPWLIASVTFAVFAAHTKVNGLFVYPVVLAGLLLGLWWRRPKVRRGLLDVGIALAIGLLLAAIWTVVENSLISNSRSDLAQVANATVNTVAVNDSTPSGLLGQITGYFRLLWNMTIIGQQGGSYDGTISPFFLILTPLLLFLPDKPKVIWELLLAALLMLVAWLAVPSGYYQNRHLIIAYPFFSILAAYAVSRLPELDLSQFSISGFFRILILLVFGIQLLWFAAWYQALNPSLYLLGLQSRSQYLSARLNIESSPGFYTMMQTMDQQLPEESIVGVAWPEPRVYYCPRECIRDVFGRTGSREQMVTTTEQEGLTHILVNRGGLSFWLDPGNIRHGFDDDQILAYISALESFVAQYGVLEFEQSDSYYLYRVELGEE